LSYSYPHGILEEVTVEQLVAAATEQRRRGQPERPVSLQAMDATLHTPQWEHLQYGDGEDPELIYQGRLGPAGRRCLLFVFSTVLTWLAANGVSRFFIDGTFDIVPIFESCQQLLFIGCNYQDHVSAI
jgi:hypothetical protein